MKRKQFVNNLLNQVYRYSNKRFEVIHARDNVTMGMYQCFIRDEFLSSDVVIEAETIRGLFRKVKAHVEAAGLSIEARVASEPIAYKY